MFEVADKVIIVTGGSRGIGFCYAKHFAGIGARVVIIDILKGAGEQATAALQAEHLYVDFELCDIADIQGTDNILKSIAQRYGRIDVLFNNAGVLLRKGAFESNEKDWEFLTRVNLKGTFFCAVNCAKIMKENCSGKIINTASNTGLEVFGDNRTIYSITKAGIVHITKVLAFEFAKYGITVNAIAPGPIITELNEEYFKAHQEEYEETVRMIPLGRYAQTKDLLGAAQFFASDASNFITGHTLPCEGGILLS